MLSFRIRIAEVFMKFLTVSLLHNYTAGDSQRIEMKGDSLRSKNNNTNFAKPHCNHYLGGTLHCSIICSFGIQKEHNDLRRVKARTKLTEILNIFFGIHTANVVKLADGKNK